MIDKTLQSQLREVERFRTAHRHIVSTFWNQFVSLIMMILIVMMIIMIIMMTVTCNDDDDIDYHDYDLSSYCLEISWLITALQCHLTFLMQ